MTNEQPPSKPIRVLLGTITTILGVLIAVLIASGIIAGIAALWRVIL